MTPTAKGGYCVTVATPGSGVVLLGDVVENTRDAWVCLTSRIPPEAALLRDDNNQFQGSLGKDGRRR